MPRASIDGFDVSTASADKIAAELKARASFTTDPSKVGKDYDLIVLANVLHHIQPPLRPGIIKDLASRLAPGGRIAVFEHNPYNPATRYIVATCEFDEDAVMLTRREALGLLRDAGLSALTGEYIAFASRLPDQVPAAGNLSPLVPLRRPARRSAETPRPNPRPGLISYIRRR